LATAFSPNFKYASSIDMEDLEKISLTNLELNTDIVMCNYAQTLGLPLFSSDSNLVFFHMQTGQTDVYRTKDGSKLCDMSRKRFRTIESSSSGSFRTVVGIFDFLTKRAHKLNIKDFIHF
jgi:methylmalonyl-CoA mutase N-terminal domain/subunit